MITCFFNDFLLPAELMTQVNDFCLADWLNEITTKWCNRHSPEKILLLLLPLVLFSSFSRLVSLLHSLFLILSFCDERESSNKLLLITSEILRLVEKEEETRGREWEWEEERETRKNQKKQASTQLLLFPLTSTFLSSSFLSSHTYISLTLFSSLSLSFFPHTNPSLSSHHYCILSLSFP